MKINILILSCFLLSYLNIGHCQTKKYAPNGGVFTPKGDLKALIVFVVFKDEHSTNPNFKNKDQYAFRWDIDKNNRLPEFVDAQTGTCPEFIYNQASDFEQYKNTTYYNYSKDFYAMSGGTFRFMGDVFTDSTGKPMVVEIDAEGCAGWTQANKKAMEQMRLLNPKFDGSRWDKRKNAPNFAFDNSDTATYKADKVLDYVVFIYRYHNGWVQQPMRGMNNWLGSTGGFANTGVHFEDAINGYRINEGFTMVHNSNVFIHEIGHTLHNAPHLFGVNGVVGEYFYRPSAGWGFTNSVAVFKAGAMAWERWYLGYMELVADIKQASDVQQKNEFVLRDFFTTGDALRVKIPYSNNQYLWIENHAKLHYLDEHIWAGGAIGSDSVNYSPSGLYIYVEALTDQRETIIHALSDKANGIKWLNAAGNYDYELAEPTPEKNAWGNDIYKFIRGKANPIAGLSPYYTLPVDLNGDKTIALDKNYNFAKNENIAITCEQLPSGEFKRFYHNLGTYQADSNYTRTPAFQGGDVLDMSSNPALTNHPKYNSNTQLFEPFYLNGLSIRLQNIPNSTNKLVKIEFNATTLRNDVRWTGNLVLPNISNSTAADLLIPKGKQLTLDKSGTPNRHTQTAQGEFINPTIFTIAADATLQIQKGGKLVVRRGTTLRIEKGGKLILDKKAKFVVESDAKLIMEDVSLQKNDKASFKMDGHREIPSN